MLKYDLFKKPLLDPDKLVFNKGVFQFESLGDVADKNPGYLVYLVEKSKTDKGTKQLVADFIAEHPDYFEEVEL